MKNFIKIICKHKTTKQCCQINEILTLLCNNYCIQCKGMNNMKKTIMMALSSVIALSCANFNTYARFETLKNGFSKAKEKIKGSTLVKSVLKAGQGELTNQLNTQAAITKLAAYQTALLASIKNLETKCTQLMPQGADANNTYSQIINELAQLNENITEDRINNFYPQANKNISTIITLCNSTEHQPLIDDAEAVQQNLDNILKAKGLSTTATPAA